MNLLLDNRTQNVVQVAVSTILFLVMLTAWRTQKTYPGFGRWTVSKVPVAIGFLLISLRGKIPDWASIFVAGVLLFISPILLYEGIRKFLGKPHRDIINYCLMGLLISGFIVSFVKPSHDLGIVILAGLYLIVMARSAWNLFIPVSPELRSSYWLTATMLGVHSLVLAIRVLTAVSLAHPHTPFVNDTWQSLLFLANIVLPIGWTFGFFMMTNIRLTLDLRTAEAELREIP